VTRVHLNKKIIKKTKYNYFFKKIKIRKQKTKNKKAKGGRVPPPPTSGGGCGLPSGQGWRTATPNEV